MSTVLVAGATGFVGQRLVPALLDAGHEVRAMTRSPQKYSGPGEAVEGDVERPETLGPAMEGVDIAYYLVHSLDQEDFEEAEARSARAFGQAAADAGVDQIVFLGGLGSETDELSVHLRSRRAVEGHLGEGGVPVTVLRAAVIVGHGGISWEITRQLVKHLPAMVVPKWAQTRTQPIALDDVVRYLVGVAGVEAAIGQVFEIGGPDQLTYVEMLQQAAESGDRRVPPIIEVPVLTPQLSARWLSLVTDVDVTTGRNLIDSMDVEVLVTDHTIREVVPFEPMTYREAVERALADRAADDDAKG